MYWIKGTRSPPYPVLRSVIRREFVESSPTRPFQTTLHSNGRKPGDIRCSATSGDILFIVSKDLQWNIYKTIHFINDSVTIHSYLKKYFIYLPFLDVYIPFRVRVGCWSLSQLNMSQVGYTTNEWLDHCRALHEEIWGFGTLLNGTSVVLWRKFILFTYTHILAKKNQTKTTGMKIEVTW